jgi:LPXTG-motif cell wall-anchored protein
MLLADPILWLGLVVAAALGAFYIYLRKNRRDE